MPFHGSAVSGSVGAICEPTRSVGLSPSEGATAPTELVPELVQIK